MNVVPGQAGCMAAASRSEAPSGTLSAIAGTAERGRKMNAVAKKTKLHLKHRGLNGVADSLPCKDIIGGLRDHRRPRLLGEQ